MKNQINTKEFESSPLIKNRPHQLSDPYQDYGKLNYAQKSSHIIWVDMRIYH